MDISCSLQRLDISKITKPPSRSLIPNQMIE